MTSSTTATVTPLAQDPSSQSNCNEAHITHLFWDASIDFTNQLIVARATYTVQLVHDNVKVVKLDTSHLDVHSVLVNDHPVTFSLTVPDVNKAHLGSCLEIQLNNISTSNNNSNDNNNKENYNAHYTSSQDFDLNDFWRGDKLITVPNRHGGLTYCVVCAHSHEVRCCWLQVTEFDAGLVVWKLRTILGSGIVIKTNCPLNYSTSTSLLTINHQI